MYHDGLHSDLRDGLDFHPQPSALQIRGTVGLRRPFPLITERLAS